MEVKTSAKGVSKALQTSSSSKIPIPFKSPKNIKTQRPVKNNLVCSTPVNSVKLHIFGTDNQFMSPIRNPSSAATSNNSSPRKALNAEQELETLLNIQKIKIPDKKETNKLSLISRCSQENDYIFQDSVPMQKMMICDSEEETLPKQSKRGRKPFVKTKSEEKNANLSSDKIVTQTSPAIETKELIQTRSKTEHVLNENELKNSKTEKKKVNSRTKTKRAPKKRTNESDMEKIEIFVENRNVGTNNDLENQELIQTCSKTETVLNIKTEKKKVSSRTRANRNLNSKKLSPASQINNDKTEIEKKNVENKTDIENLQLIHTRSKAEIVINDNKSSKKLKTSARRTINKQTKELLMEDQNKKIKDVDLLRARIDKIKKNPMNGNTKKSLNVRKRENIIYEKSENETNRNAEIEAMQHVGKRKVDTDTEYQSKKVKLQTDTKEYGFKNAAILADVSLAKAGGLADVHIDGKRCFLGCFGKFPRHCSTNSRNPDVSVGESIKNGYISTGILEIEPAGKKNYEYAKNVNLLFVVLEGIAQVRIGRSSQVMQIGQDFYVPKDTPYYIENISSARNLLLYFSKYLF